MKGKSNSYEPLAVSFLTSLILKDQHFEKAKEFLDSWSEKDKIFTSKIALVEVTSNVLRITRRIKKAEKVKEVIEKFSEVRDVTAEEALRAVIKYKSRGCDSFFLALCDIISAEKHEKTELVIFDLDQKACYLKKI